MAALSRAPCHHRSRRERAAPSLRRVRRVSMTRSTARPTAAPTPTEGRTPKVDSGAAPEGAARTLRAFEGGSRKRATPSAGRVVGQPGAVPPRCTIVTFLAERRGIPAGTPPCAGARTYAWRFTAGWRRAPRRGGSQSTDPKWVSRQGVARGRRAIAHRSAGVRGSRTLEETMPQQCRAGVGVATPLVWVGVFLRMYVALGAALWSCRRGTCYATRLSSCVVCLVAWSTYSMSSRVS